MYRLHKSGERIIEKFRQRPCLLWVVLCAGVFALSAANLPVTWFFFRRYNSRFSFSLGQMGYHALIVASFLLLVYGAVWYLKKKRPGESLLDAAISDRYLLALLFFLFCLAFRLNGFSLGVWDRWVNIEHGSNIIFGMKQDITSDIWALAIPSIFNQVDNGFPMFNRDIMTGGASSLLMGLPVWDITTLGRPFLWGYMLLGKDAGLSWHFYLKLIALFLSSFELCLYLSKGNRRLALLFAFLITYAPSIQWWFGQTIMDAIIMFQVCLASVLCYLSYSSDWRWKFISCGGLLIGGLGFILVLYPALQVPLGYLFLLMMALILWEKRSEIRLGWWDFILLGGVALVVGLILVRFLITNAEGLRLLTGTAYPGSRVSTGGDFDLQKLYYLFFQWLLPIKSATISNNCEVSSTLPFFWLMVPVFPILFRERRNLRFLPLYLYDLFLISWTFVSFPDFFAKATLFSYVTEGRVFIISGLLTTYLTLLLFRELTWKPLGPGWTATLTALCAGAGIWIIFGMDGGGYLNFLGVLSPLVSAFSIVVVAVFGLFLCRGMKKSAALLLCAATFVCGVIVNPICAGIGPLYQSGLSKSVLEIENDDPGKLWVFNEDFPFSNYLVAHGVRCFNTLNSYPDYDKWHIIDPDGKWDINYNRFGHVGVTLTHGETNINNPAPDAIHVEMTAENLAALGVEYVVSKEDVGDFGFEGVYTDEISGFSIYAKHIS